MKWPWKRERVTCSEEHEYSNLDRLDGLEEPKERPRGTWHDWRYYEERYGRTK